MVTVETHQNVDQAQSWLVVESERQRLEAEEAARRERNELMAEEDNLYANVPCTD